MYHLLGYRYSTFPSLNSNMAIRSQPARVRRKDRLNPLNPGFSIPDGLSITSKQDSRGHLLWKVRQRTGPRVLNPLENFYAWRCEETASKHCLPFSDFPRSVALGKLYLYINIICFEVNRVSVVLKELIAVTRRETMSWEPNSERILSQILAEKVDPSSKPRIHSRLLNPLGLLGAISVEQGKSLRWPLKLADTCERSNHLE